MNKKILKIISTLLTILVIFSSFGLFSSAATTDTFETAVNVTFDTKYEGHIKASNPKNFYKFTIDEDSEVSTNMLIYINTICYLYDENGAQLWKANGYRGENGLSNEVYNFELEAGTYYFCVTGNNWVGRYTVTFSAESLESDLPVEPDEPSDSTDSGNSFLEIILFIPLMIIDLFVGLFSLIFG